MTLEIGQPAPDFALQDKTGTVHRLSDFKGQKVVIYFYPKDNTSGCTKEALQFKDLYEEFQQKDTVIIGISKDSVKSHQNFSEKYDLPFLLLSDPELTTLKDYGVWQEKKMYGKTHMGTVRSTFIIDAQGIIQEMFLNVKVKDHGQDVKECVLAL